MPSFLSPSRAAVLSAAVGLGLVVVAVAVPVLRSKSPDLVQQEIWGHLCCHCAIRTLMADTAAHSGHDPDRVSFTAALRIARRSVAQGAFPPSGH